MRKIKTERISEQAKIDKKKFGVLSTFYLKSNRQCKKSEKNRELCLIKGQNTRNIWNLFAEFDEEKVNTE